VMQHPADDHRWFLRCGHTATLGIAAGSAPPVLPFQVGYRR
jgi:hypothetical protein